MQTPEKIKQIFYDITTDYDLLNQLFSLGLVWYWRQAFVRAIDPNQGETILDSCSGTGDVAIGLLKKEPLAKVISLDFSERMLELAQKKISQKGLSQSISIKKGDGMNIQFPEGSFDKMAVAFGIRNMQNWREGLTEAFRVLRPKGMIAILEFSTPSVIIRPLYLLYVLWIIPLIGGLFGHRRAYTYLGQSIIKFCAEADIPVALREAGFKDIKTHRLTFGIASIYHGVK